MSDKIKVVRTTFSKSHAQLHKLSKDKRVNTEIATLPKQSQRRKKSVALDGSALPTVKQLSSLDKCYQVLHLLGAGVSSRVFLAIHKQTKEYVAVKMIPKNILINNLDLAREISILKQISHPYIVRLHDVLITDQYLQIIMEAAHGQELFDEICLRKIFLENDARDIIEKLLDACKYLHELGIVHRDLKPENIMFIEENGVKTLKSIDFGFARNSSSKNTINVAAGTLGYKAPEILKGECHTTKADMWSLGVIAYILLVGFPPFFSYEDYKDASMLTNVPFWTLFNDETVELLISIKEGRVEYLEQYWNGISLEAKNLVQSLLKVTPEERLSAAEALEHPWFKKIRNNIVVEVVYNVDNIIHSDHTTTILPVV